jgi:hypothetical protein
MTLLIPFLVRLRPDVYSLLQTVSKDRKKSVAAVINEELSNALSKSADLDTRLDKLLG